MHEHRDLQSRDAEETSGQAGQEDGGRVIEDAGLFVIFPPGVSPVATPVLGAKISEVHYTSLAFSNCNKDQVFEIDPDVVKPENWNKKVPVGIKSEYEENSGNKERQVFHNCSHEDKAGFPATIVTLTDLFLTKAQSELNCESFVLAELWLYELRGRFSSAIDQATRKELNETERLNVILRMKPHQQCD